MIHLRLTDSPSASPRQSVRLALEHVALDRALPELDAFRASTPTECIASPDLANERPAALQWESAGTGTLAQQDLGFTVRYDAHSGYAVDLANGPTLGVAADGSSVQLNQPCAIPLTDPIIAQSILGPGLLLALALRGTFALHASAAALDGRAAVFLGESGAGKSALAADLGRRVEVGWRRLADDVLPVASGARWAFHALPEYPQLKLPQEEQYVAAGKRPERVRMAVLYLLESAPGRPDESDSIREAVVIEALSPRDALVTLIAHTIASRLFAPDLAARHFDFCAEVAAAVPVKRLIYPRRLDVFDAVAHALAADLRA